MRGKKNNKRYDQELVENPSSAIEGLMYPAEVVSKLLSNGKILILKQIKLELMNIYKVYYMSNKAIIEKTIQYLEGNPVIFEYAETRLIYFELKSFVESKDNIELILENLKKFIKSNP